MKIEPNAWALIDYVLRDEDDDIVDASDAADGEPIAYVHGYGMLVPGLEKRLVGLAAGDEREILVPPEEAFGDHDEDLVMDVERSDFPNPEAVAVGDELVLESPDGEEALVRVMEVAGESVVIDGNHPLAGETLKYTVKVREVRPATEAEIAEAAAAFEEAGYGKAQSKEEAAAGSLVQLTRRVPPAGNAPAPAPVQNGHAPSRAPSREQRRKKRRNPR